MLPQRLFYIFAILGLLHLTGAKYQQSLMDNQLKEFINNVEQLVLNTTDRGLIITRNVYLNLSTQLSAPLQEATDHMRHEYVQAVNEALQTNASYTAKRQLFKQFKANNRRIEELRAQLDPLHPEFQFQLISEQFDTERRNCTEFDNLYLEFMESFARASQQFWDNMTEQTVEDQEELLEILDEIANEQQLQEKDKLYDEFIEMYLFKDKQHDMHREELI